MNFMGYLCAVVVAAKFRYIEKIGLDAQVEKAFPKSIID